MAKHPKTRPVLTVLVVSLKTGARIKAMFRRLFPSSVYRMLSARTETQAADVAARHTPDLIITAVSVAGGVQFVGSAPGSAASGGGTRRSVIGGKRAQKQGARQI